MTTFLAFLDRAVPLLWRATWQSAMLIALILIVRAILGARLSPGWRFALWGLVLARLLSPVIPAGPFSLFRLTASMDTLWQPVRERPAPHPSPVAEPSSRDQAGLSRPPVERALLSVRSPLSMAPAGERATESASLATAPALWSPARIAGLIWLAGVLLLSARTALAAARLRRRSRDWSLTDDPSHLALFDACRRTMGVRRPVRLRATADGLGPAVTGLWRPCVLVPQAVLASASRADLEHILLHELAHVRRWDVAVHWLLTAVGIFHWFNPALWFASARMQADRELACDAAVLRRLGRRRRAAYGNTVLTLAAGFASPQPRTTLVGAFGTPRHLHERIAMIARYTPIGRGWGWLAAGLLLALAVTGLTDAANPSPAADPPVATIAMTEQAEGKPGQAATAAPGQEGNEPRQAARPIPPRIAEAIAILRATDIKDCARWAPAIRTLAEIGRPAVPPLIEELDRTTDERAIRSIAFTLRAIGDPRAVPALIRAIPHTLVDYRGDFGLWVLNPRLLAFMQKHDLTPGASGWVFAFGRPYREIAGTLHALTGQRFNEDEVNHVGLVGSPKQRWLQHRAVHDNAARWAVWWKKNWQRFTDDPDYAKVSVPPLPEPPKVAAVTADQPFPTGDLVRATVTTAGNVLGPPQAVEYYRTFKDLDALVETPWPEDLPDASKVKDDEIAAFAARTGYDLRGTEYTVPGSGKSYYAIQGLGLRAWQIDNIRFHTIDQDLRDGKPPKLDRPARDLLMDFDRKTGIYHPENKATFLFVTHEGTTGVLQLTGLVTDLVGPDDVGKPARREDMRPDPPEDAGKPAQLKSIRGFCRGVQYSLTFLYSEENEAR